MQNTRLNTLFNRTTQQFTRWSQNPWRRLSLIIISLLFGNFLASAIATTTGQRANLDTILSVTLLITTESISWLVYSQRANNLRRDEGNLVVVAPRPLWLVMLNSLKLGTIYGLFVEAFKLGS
jgi:Protein of unknown function (DUF565)